MKTILLLFCLTIIAQTQSSKFTKKEITSGITFVNEARVSLSYQKWKMVYYYNLQGYFEQIASFEAMIGEMHKACGLLKIDGSTCLTLIIKFEKYREKIDHSKSIIERYNLRGQNKLRRALITPVGTILRALFGLVDEEQAQLLNDRIMQLERNAKRKGEFSNERLSIIQSSLMSNDKRFRELTAKIITLSTQLKNSNVTTFTQIEQTLISNNFNYLAHSATLIMIEHNRISDTIIQLLTNNVSTKITELIPVDILQNNLRDISFNLEKGKKLPIDVEKDNIYEIFDMITIKSTVVNDKLLMIISLPIINEISYDLFKTVPIPTQHMKEVIIIQPSTEYILVNKAASHFIPITSTEYANCLKKPNNHLICSPTSPIYLNKHYKCEFCLFNEIDFDDLEIHCEFNIRKIQRKNYFIKLDAPNYYYVFAISPITIRFICAGREPEEMLISEHGILLIDDHCILKTDSLLIEAKYTVGNKDSIQLESPRLNISDLAKLSYVVAYNSNRTNNIEQDKGDVTLLENFSVETNELIRRVEHARGEENGINFQEPEIENHISWSKIIFSIIIFFMICVTIVMITKLIQTAMACMS